MEDSIAKYDLKEIKSDLLKAITECSDRGLKHTRKWLGELNFSLKGVKLDAHDVTVDVSFADTTEDEEDDYTLAKGYFDLKEYDRAAFFTAGCKMPKARFLHLFSRYLSGEKKKIDDMTDLPPDPLKNESLKQLCADLRKDHSAGNLDGFGLYLFGVVLKKLHLDREATEVFVNSVRKQPMHWGTWLELAALITDREKLENLSLPNHWMKKFFLAHMYLELQLIDEGMAVYCELQSMGFEKNGYVLAQIAIAVHYKRDVDASIEAFKRIIKDDPYCLDNMDTYSNLLYVKELKVELAHLAHRATKIDKYRLETCCIIGNYYSLRADHQKAALYFQRALKLNPQYLSAWTLLGHEFMEMKNTNAAIHSYRQAIEVNRRDYRAWYGLGQTYEILKMPFYGLYYYKQAQLLRPHDSRMVLALGEAYEKQEKIQDALKCYYKACNVGDIEGMALIKLATLYEKLGEQDHAAAAYTDFVMDEHRNADRGELSHAYKYLTTYHLKFDQLDQANHYAQKCLQFDETKEEAKALLRTIAHKRAKVEENPMVIEDMNETDPIAEGSGSRVDGTPGNQLSPMNLSFTPPQ
ncbi:cell division cycle protein 23 homolog isoform X1 [Neodiprion pinetum]|uniref:Cell division cycle protein 23 homolog n=2 Tax=Neodiprion TaxID=270857 RepID=A0A6J0B446_NEOLC|nr:cell division cycle protein 23 homolog [Neodiprion lecontei]XP_046466213.1 cell division cycle protein 23 homolog isoform X1 [Neodiprion pinetum]XP_046466214.1 cell division cycle protein 23 homolog isoform X1 [Neodiprion pinetum]XP_046466215.1 cell division cycle protein 23 homolog isoform X1 [Neodiprion pinetum]XP_046586462.1 cell division cycle protein 23 homolog [Neodiprion lecontei]XP_046586463.1 cell division cycle protein 23 homolog [Neodiprion lecontei]